uniref:Uncharacterized protein n=1 Tax=Rhizophora mucronata TaxID=61149 RepID=A0A2P2QCK5_RHIMU
MKKTERKQS